MKKLLHFLLVSCFFSSVSAQIPDTISNINSSVLLNKANKQKTTGWILLGLGTGISTIGTIVLASAEDSKGIEASGVLILAGTISVLGSIPFFIASIKNKRKADAFISFKMETSSYIRQYSMKEKEFPAIVLRVGF